LIDKSRTQLHVGLCIGAHRIFTRSSRMFCAS